MTRTVNRLCQFGMADWQTDELSVRTAVAPLGERHLRRFGLGSPRDRGDLGMTPAPRAEDGLGRAS